MALRLIEMKVDRDDPVDAEALLDEQTFLHAWTTVLPGKHQTVRILLPLEESEAVMNHLEQHCASWPGFRLLLLSVEATLPRPKADSSDLNNGKGKEEKADGEKGEKSKRISREELHTDVVDSTRLTAVHLVLVVISTTVATIGILRSDVAVIIGSMVIAPLLGPHVGLSLATTLADKELALTALKTSAVGLLLAFAISVGLGFVLTVDPTTAEIAPRTTPGYGDIVLALAAGGAGALAFTTAVPAAFVGVMVAVALLPPLVICGLLLGAGYYSASVGAFSLLTVNIICINLAGVVTFLAQGIRPRTWWETDKAKKATRFAISIWLILLIILITMIYFFFQT